MAVEKLLLFLTNRNSRNQTKITTAVAELKRLIDDRNLIIKDAEKLRLGQSEKGSAVTVINWAASLMNLSRAEVATD